MTAYLNLALAVMGIACGFPALIPIVNIAVAWFCFAIDKIEAVEIAKHRMWMKASRERLTAR